MPDQSILPITVLIATKNEEKNLTECLESVFWATQVLVIDSGSTDKTQQIAEDHGAEFHVFQYDGKWPKKRNWALKAGIVTQPWVLILDADERVSDELKSEMAKAISRRDIDGYYLKWKFIFLGRWMKHSWSHGWMLRLFRFGKGEYENLRMTNEGGWDAEVHENVVVDGSCAKLAPLLDHDSNSSLSYWIKKQNEFSTWNAQRRRRQLSQPVPSLGHLISGDPIKMRKWMKSVFIRLPGKPFLMFLWLYVIKGGFLDGRAGFYFCCLRASHELNICAKLFEMKNEH
jgi:glycosyltransferase involved in cell wall biosynthesis